MKKNEESMGIIRGTLENIIMKAVRRMIDDAVQLFITRLHEKHAFIDTDEAWKMWKKSKKSKKKTMNCYNLFTKEEHGRITHERPGIGFAEVSRETGRRWKNLPESKKDEYRRRVALQKQYAGNEGWDHYIDRPHPYILRIARNWFEDRPEVRIEDGMSKEEMIALILENPDVPVAAEEEPVKSPDDEDVDEKRRQEYQAKPYHELLELLKEAYPAFSDGSFTSKDDLVGILMERTSESQEMIPIEAHPYYYQLLSKTTDALCVLCEKNFPGEEWRHQDRRRLTELLVRNFDNLRLDDENENECG